MVVKPDRRTSSSGYGVPTHVNSSGPPGPLSWGGGLGEYAVKSSDPTERGCGRLCIGCCGDIHTLVASLAGGSSSDSERWVGLDWTGLDWTGLDWTGLDWSTC
jgi:hypothetical protein